MTEDKLMSIMSIERSDHRWLMTDVSKTVLQETFKVGYRERTSVEGNMVNYMKLK